MRKINNKEIRNVILLLILVSLILILFHVFRFSSSNILPTYDQYKYENVNLIIPFCVGLINSFLVYLILVRLLKNYVERFFVALVILVSPAFTYVHCTQNNIYLGLMFILLGILFLLYQKFLMAVLFLLASFAFNQIFIFVIFVILIIFLEKTLTKKTTLLIIFLVIITYIFTLVNNFDIASIHNLITLYVSDFGAIIGFGTFSLLLFLIGLTLSWKNKIQNVTLYLGLISLFVMSLFNNSIIIFLDLIVGFFAGKTLYYFQTRKWESELLKNYVVLLIFCGLIFTSGSYIKRISDSGPYEPELNSLIWLSQQKPGKVLSNYEYGYLINSITDFEVYIDKDYYISSKNKERILETKTIFQSRNLDEIMQFLENNDISYIWITKEMKKNIWKKPDQGILLILENSKYFTKVYNYDVEIWKFNRFED